MRALIFQALSGSAGLTDIVDNRIFQASDLTNVPPRPFVTYRLHNAYARQGFGKQTLVQVWFHDEPGDYMRIDEMMGHAKTAIEGIPQQGSFMEAVWFEDSVDLQDDDMGTITRNARYIVTETNTERYT